MIDPVIQCKYDELWPLDKFIPHPRNPNKHPEKQIKLLAKIMTHNDVRSPIVVSKNSGFMTKGHGRLLAAQLNEFKHYPVEFQEYKNEALEWADIVADNKIAELANVDLEIVKEEALKFKDELDFDLMGIPDFSISISKEGNTDDDSIPENVEAKTKLGELYQLGNHRLMCGDSTNVEHVQKVINGNIPVVCVTDPPYCVNYENQEREPGRQTRKSLGDQYKDPTNAFDLLNGFISILPADLLVMSFPVNKHFHSLSKATKNWDLLYDCVWVKNHFAFIMGRRYQPKHEPILIFRRKNKKSYFDVPSNQSTVFEFDKPSKNKDHPTVKPVGLYELLTKYHSPPKGVVYEPFGGSGTTLIACEKMDRICCALEIEPQYCDVIIKRWEDFTGQKAQLIEGGQDGQDGQTQD